MTDQNSYELSTTFKVLNFKSFFLKIAKFSTREESVFKKIRESRNLLPSKFNTFEVIVCNFIFLDLHSIYKAIIPKFCCNLSVFQIRIPLKI